MTKTQQNVPVPYREIIPILAPRHFAAHAYGVQVAVRVPQNVPAEFTMTAIFVEHMQRGDKVGPRLEIMQSGQFVRPVLPAAAVSPRPRRLVVLFIVHDCRQGILVQALP